jgi:glutamate dehydrogenase
MDSKRKASGLTIKTDMVVDSFPEYVDTFESSDDTMTDSLPAPSAANRPVDKLRETDPERHPSPQPTHVSYPLMAKVNGNGHRVLRSATVGYVSPEFKGKTEQMKQGEL